MATHFFSNIHLIQWPFSWHLPLSYSHCAHLMCLRSFQFDLLHFAFLKKSKWKCESFCCDLLNNMSDWLARKKKEWAKKLACHCEAVAFTCRRLISSLLFLWTTASSSWSSLASTSALYHEMWHTRWMHQKWFEFTKKEKKIPRTNITVQTFTLGPEEEVWKIIAKQSKTNNQNWASNIERVMLIRKAIEFVCNDKQKHSWVALYALSFSLSLKPYCARLWLVCFCFDCNTRKKYRQFSQNFETLTVVNVILCLFCSLFYGAQRKRKEKEERKKE